MTDYYYYYYYYYCSPGHRASAHQGGRAREEHGQRGLADCQGVTLCLITMPMPHHHPYTMPMPHHHPHTMPMPLLQHAEEFLEEVSDDLQRMEKDRNKMYW